MRHLRYHGLRLSALLAKMAPRTRRELIRRSLEGLPPHRALPANDKEWFAESVADTFALGGLLIVAALVGSFFYALFQ
jgi:hypothetical protein